MLNFFGGKVGIGDWRRQHVKGKFFGGKIKERKCVKFVFKRVCAQKKMTFLLKCQNLSFFCTTAKMKKKKKKKKKRTNCIFLLKN